MPAVSVVIPHFRACATLPETLASARAQSVSDVEILIVDDGSDEAARAFVATLAAQDARVRPLFQANRGVSVARNAGVLAASAPIVAFLDADDLWPVDHLAVHLERFAATASLDVSFSAANLIDVHGAVIGAARAPLTGHSPRSLLLSNPTTTTSSWVARRAAFDRFGLFDPALRHAEDQEWLVRAALGGAVIEGTDRSRISYRTAVGGLASDLVRMRSGVVAMHAALRRRSPAFIDDNGREALACTDRTLARHALRIGLPRRAVLASLWRAVVEMPSLLVREPRRTLGLGLAALSPVSIR